MVPITSYVRDLFERAVRQGWRRRRTTMLVVATIGPAVAFAALLVAAVGSVLTADVPLIDSDRVVQAFQTFNGVRYAWSYPQVRDVIENAKSADFAGASFFPKTLATPQGPQFVWFEAVTTNYPEIVDVRPAYGRWFTAEENSEPLRDHVVVLGDELCRKLFVVAASCLGKSIPVGNTALTVIGVMPRSFRGLQGTATAWTPLMLAPLGIGRQGVPFAFWTAPSAHWMMLVGRLRSPDSAPEVQAEVRRLYRAFAIQQKWITSASSDRLLPQPEVLTMREAIVDPTIARAGRIVQIVAFVLLLMSAANAGLLLFARVHARAGEFAIRLAIGATMPAILAEVVAETMVMALGAAAFGAVLSVVSAAAVSRLAGNTDLMQLAGATLSVDVLRRNVVATAAQSAGVVLALLPLIILAVCWLLRRDWIVGDVALSRRSCSAMRPRGWQAVIVAAQMGCAVVLTVASGLLIVSYRHAVTVPLGFSARSDVMSLRPSASPGDLSAADSDALVTALAETPGVTRVARLSCLPLSRACFGTGLTAAEPGDEPGGAAASAVLNRVDVDAFGLLGMTVREGRGFTSDDRSTAPKVAVVSRSVANLFRWPAPIVGRRLVVAGFGDAEIVGVVDDVKYDGMTEAPKPTVYVAWTQYAAATPELLLVGTAGSAAGYADRLRSSMRSVREPFAAAAMVSLDRQFENALSERRLQVAVVSGLALIGLVLLIAGVSGVTSFVARLGLREIGIRLALGATPGAVVGLIVGRMAWWLGIGGTAGVALWVVTRQWWTPLLYRVDALDPPVLAGCIATAFLAALITVLRVISRAARLDPVETLRAD